MRIDTVGRIGRLAVEGLSIVFCVAHKQDWWVFGILSALVHNHADQ